MAKYLSDEVAIVATIDPGAILDDTTVWSDFVDMSLFGELTFFVEVGDLDTTVTCTLYENTSASDSGATVVSGKSAIEIAADDDRKQVILATADQEVGKRYVGLQCVVGNGASGAYLSAIGVGSKPRYKASDSDLASVDTIVDKD